METTIAINQSTAQMLAYIKKKMNARSIDEVIVEIVRKVENLPKSKFGSRPDLKSFKREERAKFHEL
ncbi:hypothetical protein J4221_06080 [Candidatus Pacearchaeota archaeon]|nr:hypothetical protein [Candidatus Pacearchaeota archaeon]